jgi:aminopeptidase N
MNFKSLISIQKGLCACMVFGTLSCEPSKKTELVLETGISLELATYRKQQVKNIVYNLSFKIPEDKQTPIAAVLNLEVDISDLEQPLFLDFNADKANIHSVTVNDISTEVKTKKEHVIIEQEHLKIGANTVEINFTAGELSLNRNEDYLYTLFVPDRASTAFPCFDQPDLKGTYKLNITAPIGWDVLCGAPLETKTETDGFANYQYEATDKMSTYLFSFVAGDFKEITQQLGVLNMKMLHRETSEEKITASTDEIFKLHHNAVIFLEDYTQQKFPFKKLDFACIPGFQYGGMEHVGAIQYRSTSLFLDNNATDSRKLGRCKLIAHETAHMWFGDLVTMKWFNDVWMKEVFANFMADKIANPIFPEINHALQFMTTHYPSAYSEDRTKGANPIRQKLDNLKNAGTLYGRIIYNKAPIMMRQLEAVMGESNFKTGIQEYIKTFANSNADWNELVAILDSKTDVDMKRWSDVWVNQSGRPIIDSEIAYKEGKISSFKVSQSAEDGSANLWAQSFDVGLVYPSETKVVSVQLDEKNVILKDAEGLPKPETIIYNYNGFGYGIFPIDANKIEVTLSIADEVARGYSYINLYENTLNGAINPDAAFKVLANGFVTENEELIARMTSGYAQDIFWKYLTKEERLTNMLSLEARLKNRLHEDLSIGMKKTVFNFYRGLAYSDSGKDFLYQLWSKKINIPNLKLNENDYTGIASALAIFEHKDSKVILEMAKEAISNPDRKLRFAFLLPSLSSDESVRNAFMQSLSVASNREKESWVLTALGNIHHPLRQASAQQHLKMSLEMLEEIQLTGDIFFPKGWLNNTIGNYSSQYAFDVLETFLNENSEFNPVLKNKLLQSADGLYRAKTLNLEK